MDTTSPWISKGFLSFIRSLYGEICCITFCDSTVIGNKIVVLNRINFVSDGEDNPRVSVPRPTVTTSGGTQSSIMTHRGTPVQRQPPLSGTTGAHRHHGTGRNVTVKAVGRSDLQGQKPVAGMGYLICGVRVGVILGWGDKLHGSRTTIACCSV